MLTINRNIIFIISIYLLLIFIELFHFASDVYIVIMLESFLCFSVLLYLSSFIFQDIFSFGLYIINLKYTYIYFFFKNIINLNIHVYISFLNIFIFFLFFLLKNFKLIQNLKNKLKWAYLTTFFKRGLLINCFTNKNLNYKFNLFI